MRKRLPVNAGFTLIELLMVVAIIGMLASIIVGSLSYARVRARDIKRIVEIQNIQTALQLYFENNGTYPTTPFGIQKSLKNPPTPQASYMSEPKEIDNGAYLRYEAHKNVNWTDGSDVCSGTDKCLSYHVGASLELDGSLNQVLNSDADKVDDDVDGLDNGGCDAVAKEANRYCYDLVPQ